MNANVEASKLLGSSDERVTLTIYLHILISTTNQSSIICNKLGIKE